MKDLTITLENRPARWPKWATPWPVVRISAGDDELKALALHSQAHHYCFIANSVKFPIDITPEIVKASDSKD